jgi:3-methyladenine DNA glycosylase AlkD
MALSHNNLGSYFKTNFSLMQHHNYSLLDIENMIPWERDIYVAMLLSYIKEENDKRKN